VSRWGPEGQGVGRQPLIMSLMCPAMIMIMLRVLGPLLNKTSPPGVVSMSTVDQEESVE
jgi:hypothetical protein